MVIYIPWSIHCGPLNWPIFGWSRFNRPLESVTLIKGQSLKARLFGQFLEDKTAGRLSGQQCITFVIGYVSGPTGSAPGADPAEKSGRIRSRSRIRSNAPNPVRSRSRRSCGNRSRFEVTPSKRCINDHFNNNYHPRPTKVSFLINKHCILNSFSGFNNCYGINRSISFNRSFCFEQDLLCQQELRKPAGPPPLIRQELLILQKHTLAASLDHWTSD